MDKGTPIKPPVSKSRIELSATFMFLPLSSLPASSVRRAASVNNIALKKDKDKVASELKAIKAKYGQLSDEDIAELQALKERRALAGDDDGGDGKTPESKRTREELAAKMQQQLREQLKTEREKWLQSEYTPVERERDEWRTKWKEERLSNRLKELGLKGGVFPDELETFIELVIYKRHFDLDEDGNPIFLQDGDPSPISAEKAISETLREKYKRFYESPAQGGSGSQPGPKGHRSAVDWHKLSPAERIAYGRKTTARA